MTARPRAEQVDDRGGGHARGKARPARQTTSTHAAKLKTAARRPQGQA
jgi:hypothetical protein